jgi:biopolymer transport protein ExbB
MIERLIEEAIEVWIAGGWAMIALAVNAFIMFAVGMGMWLRFRVRGFRAVPESTWKRWMAHPAERRGALGRLIGFLMGAEDLHDLGVRFHELHQAEVAPFNRDLRFMRRAVSTAPLLGLLGTVTGMLTTFSALATGSGGEKTMDMVAGGISEALITTQTGLIIAIPGLFFQYLLSRERDRYEAYLAHLETACTQYFCTWKKILLQPRNGPVESDPNGPLQRLQSESGGVAS